MRYLFVLLFFVFTLNPTWAQQNQNAIQTQSSLAIRYYNAKDYEKAIPLLYNVYELTKSNTYFKYYLDCLIQLERFDEAELQIQREIKKQNPPNPEFYVHWGQILKARKNDAGVKEKYAKAIESIPPNKANYQILANAFLTWGEFEQAKQTYLKGKEVLAPEPFSYELARAYMYLRDYENMMEEYLDLLKQSEQQLPQVQSSLASAMRLDIDDDLRDGFREQVLKRIQAEPDVIGYNRLLIWFFLQENKFASALRQSVSLDRRTGAEDAQIIQLGSMALNNRKYDDAKKAFDYLLGKGSENPFYAQSFAFKIHASYLQYVAETPNDKALGEKIVEEFNLGLEFLGIGPSTLNLVQEQAHLLAFYLEKSDEALALLNKGLEVPRLKPEQSGLLKTEMADIYVYVNDPWEATLVYSQVIDANKNNTLGDDVKLKKAKLAYYMGNFSWAKAQLDVLKASTSKLTANDAMELSLHIGNNLNLDTTAAPLSMFARADLLFFQNKNEKAMAVLDSLTAIYPYHSLIDDILLRKAKIEIEHENYQQAAEYLEKIIADFSYDLLADDALFMTANLYHYHLNDLEKAKDLYKQMLTRYPGSIYVDESRLNYRELRKIYPDKESDFEIQEPVIISGEENEF